jgi:hypothetical protein
MSRPKRPIERERTRKEPSPKTRSSEHHEEHERTVPGRRNPEYVKQEERVVNEDEQQKATNYREDNAQTASDRTQEENHMQQPRENENERIEAGDDYSEVDPRPRKVN